MKNIVVVPKRNIANFYFKLSFLYILPKSFRFKFKLWKDFDKINAYYIQDFF